MRRILTLIFFMLSCLSLNVFANETNDCLELSNDRLIAHNINTPHLDNCYIIDNNNNSALSVTVGFIDRLQGTLDRDFGQFDNLPEDPEEIIAGYQAHEDGCEPDTNASNTPTSSSGSSAGGGWSLSF